MIKQYIRIILTDIIMVHGKCSLQFIQIITEIDNSKYFAQFRVGVHCGRDVAI